MSAFLLVSAGGFVGANVRYGISLWAARRFGAGFPVGTLIANLGGSFLMGFALGLLAGWFDDDRGARLLLATGFLGAETTFSTWTWETMALIREGQIRDALRNLLGSIGLGVIAATLGLVLAWLLTDGLTG
ncbi:MAG TPA: fluoride efflux transporter CrcB [Thermomicrobiales bacterium]|jgi:CrcB protein|nr:fluoride efflux transporter CrcB [Thermomicrobiales bacterium]